MAEEIELKFRVARPLALRQELRAAGFRVTRARTREINWLFDTTDEQLRTEGRVLRLRKAGGSWLLTAKGPRRPGLLKRREERQTAVTDGPKARAALARAGFHESASYTVVRTLYGRTGEQGEVAWDETPLGTFIEIEGSAAWVRRTAVALGLGLEAAERRSYPEMLSVRQRRGRKSKAPEPRAGGSRRPVARGDARRGWRTSRGKPQNANR